MRVARQADANLSQFFFLPHSLTKINIVCSIPGCAQANHTHTPRPPYLQHHWSEHSCQGEFAAHWQRLSIGKPESLSRWHMSHFFSSLSSSRGGWKKKKKNWPWSSCWFMLLFWSRGFILISWMNESVPLFQMIRVSVCPWNISQPHCDIMNKICCVFCES